MSYVNDDTLVAIVSSDPIETAGQVVTRSGTVTANTVQLADTDGEYPYGVAFKATTDFTNPAYNTFLDNQEITVQRKGIAYVPLVNDNAEIKAGDPITSAAGTKTGCCDKLTWASDSSANLDITFKKLLGWAQEAKSASAGATFPTKIKVLLDIRTA